MHRGGAVCAAAGADPLPPAGLPQPGSEVGGADEEGGGKNCCRRHPEEGQKHFYNATRFIFLSIKITFYISTRFFVVFCLYLNNNNKKKSTISMLSFRLHVCFVI